MLKNNDNKESLTQSRKKYFTVYPNWDIFHEEKTFHTSANISLGDTVMKTQTTIRVDQDSYTQAKKILKYLGLSYSQAINIFNNMIVSTKGIPFEIKIPNNVTLQAMEEAKALHGDFVTLDDFKK